MNEHNILIATIIGSVLLVTIGMVYWAKHLKNIQIANMKVKEPPETATLIVTTKDKRIHSYTYEGSAGFSGHPAMRKFARWYFGRGQSEYFVMECTNGQEVIVRSGIAHIAIKEGEM